MVSKHGFGPISCHASYHDSCGHECPPVILFCQLHGLTKAPQYNALLGTEVAGGRLGVKLDQGQELGLKQENLLLVEDSSSGLAAAASTTPSFVRPQPCGACLVHKAYCLEKSRDLKTNYKDKIRAENPAELRDDLDKNTLEWAIGEADEFSNWQYLADSISDAGV